MRQSDLTHFKRALDLSQKWLHLAIYLGYLATEHGADQAEIDRLIRMGNKAEIDRLLLEKMDQHSNLPPPSEYDV